MSLHRLLEAVCAGRLLTGDFTFVILLTAQFEQSLIARGRMVQGAEARGEGGQGGGEGGGFAFRTV